MFFLLFWVGSRPVPRELQRYSPAGFDIIPSCCGGGGVEGGGGSGGGGGDDGGHFSRAVLPTQFLKIERCAHQALWSSALNRRQTIPAQRPWSFRVALLHAAMAQVAPRGRLPDVSCYLRASITSSRSSSSMGAWKPWLYSSARGMMSASPRSADGDKRMLDVKSRVLKYATRWCVKPCTVTLMVFLHNLPALL